MSGSMEMKGKGASNPAKEGQTLFTKLNLGANDRILVLDPPPFFEALLERLQGIHVLRRSGSSTRIAFAMGFATTKSQLDRLSATLAKATEGDAVLWIAYPKASSKRFLCDFDRDTGWNVIGNAGFEPVRQVALDEDWTALRFRRTEFIRKLTRSSSMAISAEGRKRVGR